MNNIIPFSEFVELDEGAVIRRNEQLVKLAYTTTHDSEETIGKRYGLSRAAVWARAQKGKWRRPSKVVKAPVKPMDVKFRKKPIEVKDQINPYANPALESLHQRATAPIEMLARHMVDAIPNEAWTKHGARILDPAMAGGQFIRAANEKLRDEKVSEEDIAMNVYGSEADEFTVFKVAERNELKKHRDEPKTLGKFEVMPYNEVLEREPKVKFDVTLSNPPYQAVTTSEKDNTQGDFWWKFLKKSMENSKYIAFVTPKSIFSSGRFGSDLHKVTHILHKGFGFTHIWTDTSSHFNVGIETVAFVLKKGYKGKTLLVDTGEEITVDDKTPLPFHLSKVNQSIIRKTYNKDNRWGFTEKIEPKKDDYIIGLNAGRYKKYQKLYIGLAKNNPNSNAQGMYIDRSKVSNYRSIFHSKLFSYIFYAMGGEAAQSSTSILQSLPYVDPSRQYTDKQLYKMFDLNQREIDQIESTFE